MALGRPYVSAALAEYLAMGTLAEVSQAVHERLSTREFEILRLLSSGLSLKEIAARIGVNPKTVSTFRARILAKLELRTNADIVRYALEHHLN